MTVSAIRKAIALLKSKSVKPKNGYYTAYVPITPLTEQKFADFWDYGINSKNDWLTVFCYGFAHPDADA